MPARRITDPTPNGAQAAEASRERTRWPQAFTSAPDEPPPQGAMSGEVVGVDAHGLREAQGALAMQLHIQSPRQRVALPN